MKILKWFHWLLIVLHCREKVYKLYVQVAALEFLLWENITVLKFSHLDFIFYFINSTGYLWDDWSTRVEVHVSRHLLLYNGRLSTRLHQHLRDE